MQIVSIEQAGGDLAAVHTIDVWYSQRRHTWVVERLGADGRQIGVAHHCEDEAEAAACLAEWMRAHEDVHLVAPREVDAAERRILAQAPRSRAA